MESCGVGVGGVGGESRKRGRVKDGADGDGDEPAAKRLPLVPWAPHQNPPHPASRIYRVSRASGGKDRHSKVYTAKGIRDRRVRLSVATAIQFYDLQDRLGYDQPSKAIEWLIKAAADAIDKLPELHNNFPSHPASAVPAAAANGNGNKDKAEREEAAGDHGSGCSSTSETSKGSVLSLSRSESRVKARERARERSAAKDPAAAGDDTARPAPTSSFTELLTGMSAAAAADHKQQQPPTSSWTADYIGFAHQPPPRKPSSTLPQAFASAAPHLAGGNNIPPPAQQQQLFGLSAAGVVTVASQPHTEMPTQHFSFLQHEPPQQQDHQHHFMPAVHAPPAGDYNLNFSMSSGGSGLVMGVNSRGTLQSNSPQISSAHHHQQLQRLSSAPLEAAAPNNIPFLFTPAAAPITADTQFAAAFQLWNGFHHHAADMKEKGKN